MSQGNLIPLGQIYNFFLLFNYSYPHFLSFLSLALPTHHLSYSILSPPVVFVHGSFIHVPGLDFSLCFPYYAPPPPFGQCWKQPKCPSVNEWVKELWYIYTMEYYAAEGKKELLPFTTVWMDLESLMLNEIRQVVKDKCHMISPISGT